MNSFLAVRKRNAPPRPYSWTIIAFASLLIAIGVIGIYRFAPAGYYLPAVITALAALTAADSATALAVTAIQGIRRGWPAGCDNTQKMELIAEAVRYAIPHTWLIFFPMMLAIAAARYLVDVGTEFIQAIATAVGAIAATIAVGALQSPLGPRRFRINVRRNWIKGNPNEGRLGRSLRYGNIALVVCATALVATAVFHWITASPAATVGWSFLGITTFTVGDLLDQWRDRIMDRLPDQTTGAADATAPGANPTTAEQG